MQKLMVSLLVGIIALAPAIAAAQSSSGGGASGSSGTSSSGSTPSSTSGGTGSGTSGTGSSTTGGSGSATGSPAASPSGAEDFAKYTTQADCEKAGGMWESGSQKCEAKK